MKNISPSQAKAMLDSNDKVVLLDVRENDEVSVSKIQNSMHIPMNSVASRIDELDKTSPTLVICRAGGRSARVAQYLEAQGFTDVMNVEGGMQKWAQQLDPTMPVA